MAQNAQYILVIVSSIQLIVAFYKLICWVLHSLLHIENIYSQYLHDFKVLKASTCITWWEPHGDPRRQSSYDYRSPLNVIYGRNDGPETHSHGPTSQSRVHGLCSPSAAPKPLMDIFVELFIAPKQQELAELLLRCEPFDLGFLSQWVRLDYLHIIL